jgi:hypothetical protein
MDGRRAHRHAHVAAQAVAHVRERNPAVLVQVLLELAHDIHRHLDAGLAHATTLLRWRVFAKNRSSGNSVGNVVVYGCKPPVATTLESTNDALFGELAVYHRHLRGR